jgi:GNAT superfamily N-acetyltransferase
MTRSTVTLRAAVPADALALVDLWSDVVRRADPEEQAADLRAVIARVEASSEERLVVAEYDGDFAGAVHLRVTTISPLNNERIVLALAPYVLARFQRHGIGRQLMDAAVAWAEELGIGHVATAAGASSRDGNRFMARLALGPYAVLRVAPTHAVRGRLTAGRRSVQGTGGRQLTQVLAARRSMRRARAAAEG